MSGSALGNHSTPSNESTLTTDNDCVPFFKSKKSQIVFEFWFLVVSFCIAAAAVYFVARFESGSMRPLLLAALGGFLGGWTFDAKWFYRVTARGKDDQHKHSWQRHKFYWRILIPFVAGLISFAAYLLASSEALPIQVKDPHSGRIAFGLTYFLGLFTDIILSRLAKWTESLVPNGGP